MRPREVIDVDLEMVLIVGRNRTVALAEEQVLPGTCRNTGKASIPILQWRGLGTHYLGVKAGDSVRGSWRYVELDIRDANRHLAEALARPIATDAVAPRAGRLDITVALMAFEAGTRQCLANPAQPPWQSLAVRDHHTDMTTHHLGFAGGKVELLSPDID